MVTMTTPTFQDIPWGTEPCQKFDYWQNPERETGGNPVVLVRHGGGGVSGSYKDYRTDAPGPSSYMVQWLAGAQPATNPARHWDVCSFGSGQRTFLGGEFPRTKATLYHDAIRDCQAAIATIRRMLPTYGGDPERCVGMGFSYGSTLLALSQMAPPLEATGRRTVWKEREGSPSTHSSKLRGLVFCQGQIDFRKISAVDYISYVFLAGWHGTSITSSTEADGLADTLRDQISLRAYLAAGEVDGFPGIYSSYQEQGGHVKPYNAHDSSQHADLLAAMTAAGVESAGTTYPLNSLINSLWPAGPGATELAIYQTHEAWMAGRIA